jgi:hypothetical protein
LKRAVGARRLPANEALREANDMSHEDPSRNDATKTPPDRGGSSFLRIHARWTAFSLAAVVLLHGSRALADDGPRVHIDSPVPATLAVDSGYKKWWMRPPPAGGFASGRPVCGSPCDEEITAGRYVITGSFPQSPLFSLPDLRGEVTITVQPGSYGRRTAGFYAMLFGPISLLAPGLLMLTVGRSEGSAALSGAGIGLMVTGGVTAIVGGVLIATSSTTIKLQNPGVGPVGKAAKVEPRYWMGEF